MKGWNGLGKCVYVNSEPQVFNSKKFNLAHDAILSAESRWLFTRFRTVVGMYLMQPFDEHPESEFLAQEPPEWGRSLESQLFVLNIFRRHFTREVVKYEAFCMCTRLAGSFGYSNWRNNYGQKWASS